MRAFLLVAATAGLCQAVQGSGDFVDLEPVPRYLWDPNVAHQKRDGSAQEPNVTLGDHEQMLWSTGNREICLSLFPHPPFPTSMRKEKGRELERDESTLQHLPNLPP
jgi:hypothetical protein